MIPSYESRQPGIIPLNVSSYTIHLSKIAEDLKKPTPGTKLISGRAITGSVNFAILKKFLAATEPSEKSSRQSQLWRGLQKDSTPESWAYRAWDRDSGGRKSQGKEYSHNAQYPSQYQKPLRGPSKTGIDFRLIDVNQECLVSATPAARYVALSYVWGNLERTYLRNCKANVKMLHTPGAIRYNDSEVPRTVRDAIITAINLEYQYLWVDTLCIIQDDASDKGDQIRKMADIYQMASLTIVASAGSDADAGIPGVSTTSRDQWQYVFGHDDACFANQSFQLEPLIVDTKWFSRGWTYQEYALSRRNLLFTQKEVYFLDGRFQFRDQATCFYHSESDVSRIPLRFSGNASDLASCHIVSQQPRPSANLSTGISMFSTRNLSLQSDALNAFEGIARYLLDGFRGPLIFGIPITCREPSLCWVLSKPLHRPKNRPGFPSWSWASYDEAITPIQLEADELPSMRVLWRSFVNDTGKEWICDEDLTPSLASKEARKRNAPEAKKWKLVRKGFKTGGSYRRRPYWKYSEEGNVDWQHARPILPSRLWTFAPLDPESGCHLHLWTHLLTVGIRQKESGSSTYKITFDGNYGVTNNELDPIGSLQMDGMHFKTSIDIILLFRAGNRFSGNKYEASDQGYPYPRSDVVLEEEHLGQPWDVVQFRADAAELDKPRPKNERFQPLYSILAIETVNGISYRRGAGNINIYEFHRAKPERRYIVLG